MKIPKETQKQIFEARAALACRDKAIESVFYAKRALQYQETYDRLLMKIKKTVYSLYPDLEKGTWHWWIWDDGIVEVYSGYAESTQHTYPENNA